MVWYDMVWYSMIWYGMVWLWYGTVWYGMVWYGMVWYGTVRYGVVCPPVILSIDIFRLPFIHSFITSYHKDESFVCHPTCLIMCRESIAKT